MSPHASHVRYRVISVQKGSGVAGLAARDHYLLCLGGVLHAAIIISEYESLETVFSRTPPTDDNLQLVPCDCRSYDRLTPPWLVRAVEQFQSRNAIRRPSRTNKRPSARVRR